MLHRDFPGLFHGFLTMMAFAPAAAGRELLWADLRELLRPRPGSATVTGPEHN